MTERKGYEWIPDVALPPGATIAELLEDRGITQTDFALMLGRTQKNVSQLINGRAPVTHGTAIELERVLGVPASFWNSAEAGYRDALARSDVQCRLNEQSAWAKRFPLKQMREHDWIARETSPAQTSDELLRFFGVASPDGWSDYWGAPRRLAARMSTAAPADLAALTAWLRAGEREVQQAPTAPFDEARFREVLQQLRTATRLSPEEWQPLLVSLCADAGVAVVLVPELPRIRCYAVSWWLTPEKAAIQLCLRRRSDDQFWFSFFHEAAHLLKHGRRRAHIHDLDGDPREEAEADAFARNLLIPVSRWQAFTGAGRPTKAHVEEFAESVGIAASIVVGRLQHEGLVPHNQMNGLKTWLEWGSAE